nr:DNA polymerase III subunit delta' [Tsuneonella aeria]
MIGHEPAWAEWRDAIAGGRMHHAWLLAGKRGLGKGIFARDAAREMVAEPGVPQPEGMHPDVIVLSHPPRDEKEERKREAGEPYERKRNIPVDSIRAMQKRLTTRPTLGSRRVVIIDPSDDMEKGASNALLKSLEEPPAGTFFMLVAHRPARLLPTIRSRCRTLRFAPIPDQAIDRLLMEEAPEADAAARAAAVAAAGGSPGAAFGFLSQKLGVLDTLMQKIVAEGDADFALRGQLAAAIGPRPDRDRMAATIELARARVASMAPGAPRSAIPAVADAHADLVNLAAQAPIYNFDPGLLAMQIGGLLASVAPASERGNG